MTDNGMYQGYSVEGSAELKLTPENTMKDGVCPSVVPTCTPIYECPEERCIHKQIIHDVNHIKPVNTRVINHHIYRHTYTPVFTCTEENEICNVNVCGPRFM